MSKNNGVKRFLYVILSEDQEDPEVHILRSDHDPSRGEAAKAVGLDDEDAFLVAVRLDEGEIIDLPPLPAKQ